MNSLVLHIETWPSAVIIHLQISCSCSKFILGWSFFIRSFKILSFRQLIAKEAKIKDYSIVKVYHCQNIFENARSLSWKMTETELFWNIDIWNSRSNYFLSFAGNYNQPYLICSLKASAVDSENHQISFISHVPSFCRYFCSANCSYWQQVIVWWGPGNQTTKSMMIIIIITVVQSNLSLSSANPFKLYSPESVCYNCVVSPGNLHAWLILVSDQVMTSADHRDHINSVDQLSSGLQCLPTDRVNWYLEWTILSWARTLNIDVDQLISDDHNISNDNKQTITDSAASLSLIMKLSRR